MELIIGVYLPALLLIAMLVIAYTINKERKEEEKPFGDKYKKIDDKPDL